MRLYTQHEVSQLVAPNSRWYQAEDVAALILQFHRIIALRDEIDALRYKMAAPTWLMPGQVVEGPCE